MTRADADDTTGDVMSEREKAGHFIHCHWHEGSYCTCGADRG